MNPIIVNKRMTRDEMFIKFPKKYLVTINEDDGFGQLNIESGKLYGFLVAAFESQLEAGYFTNEDTKKAGSVFIAHSDDYMEEVFNLGFIFVVNWLNPWEDDECQSQI